MRRILRTQLANEDLQEIWRYIAIESQRPEAALNMLGRIDDAIATLSTQPLLGQSLPEIRVDLRMHVVGTYIIFYRPLIDGILIYRVLHGARNWQELL